ncbi:Protein CBR-FRPR-1 [Dirofilaria immitis]|nr:Protein CBR-FRPR-1 [Dirofilaria immitis]
MPMCEIPGSNKCLSYDNRLQAANIDEALHTFPDLSIMTESALPLIYEAPKMYKCDGKECKACKRLIINAFLKANNNDFSSMNNIASEMPIDTDESLCIRNRSISRNVNHAIENATIAKEFSLHMKEFINLLKPKLRKRRNSNESKQKCEEIAQGWCGLCNLCWQWRKLPDDYFPTLLNEVSCDINDEKCLTGLGNCRPIMRAINILRNVGSSKSPRWIQKSVNTISACECQIAVGTPLYSLASH